MSVARFILFLSLAAVNGLRVNQVPTSEEYGYPKENLQDDEWVWWKTLDLAEGQDSVKTISDGCENFQGSGFKCHIEMPEHALVRKWIPEDAVVMEFGARFGSTTCEIAKKLKNSGKIIAVEPDPSVHGFLKQNLQSNNCHARVLHGVVGSAPVKVPKKTGYGTRTDGSKGITVPNYSMEEIKQAMGNKTKVDTLLIDCEGCARFMMDQIGPLIENDIKLVILEADAPIQKEKNGMDYSIFLNFMQQSGFNIVDQFNDCDRERTGESPKDWCGKEIQHYAFKKA